MRFNDQIRYPADPQRVFAMIVDPAFQEAKCVATGALEHEVDVSAADDGSAVVISTRAMPTDQLPEFVRGFVGGRLTLVETQRWNAPAADGGRTGTITVDISGAPIRFSGRLRLEGDADGTTQALDGDLKAAVPLVGGRIEKAAEPALRMGVRVEGRTGAEWLAQK